MDVMQHWNLLYLNCLGFFSDPGYLLLSLLPVPCLEKGRFGRSVCGDRRKEPSPGRLIEVSLKKNGKGLSGHIVLPALRSGTFVWGEQQLNLVGGRNTIAHLFPLAISISLNSGPTIDNLLELPLVGSLTSVRLS